MIMKLTISFKSEPSLVEDVSLLQLIGQDKQIKNITK